MCSSRRPPALPSSTGISVRYEAGVALDNTQSYSGTRVAKIS